LIVCDIDFFKQINDNYNHHIGDQALVSFAGLLKKFVRSNDIVARYGGEEFVILCANCDIDSAVERAEEIRVTLTKTPQQMLDGKCITASFGVSELQRGDSPTDFFVRADTALLRAKELGRNRVVEANASELGGAPELKSAELTSLAGVAWRKVKGQTLINEEYATSTPISVLVEKLRGFIVETEAEIRRVDADFASLVVEAEDAENFSRKGKFTVDIEFQEKDTEGENQSFGKRKKTYIRITVREAKRSWFATNAVELAPSVVAELRRYFMINDDASKLKVAPAATKPSDR
jgi:diguanylate cyclase (GGDEF)-like protein